MIGFRGEYENRLDLPESLRHVCQFLTKVSPSFWADMKETAKDLGRINPPDVKIRASSYQKIIESSTPKHIVKSLIIEHRRHNDFLNDFHLGGGVHDAINICLEEISKKKGGETVSSVVGLEELDKPTERERLFAKLLQHCYKANRPETVGDFCRLDEFDTKISSIWFDGKQCFLTVVGPEDRYRKIQKVESVDSTNLSESLASFYKEYPLPLTVCTHSFGFELFLNAVVQNKIEDIFSFNPASCTEQTKNKNIKYFVNMNNVIVNRSSNLSNERLVFGPILECRAAAHAISQWV